MGKTVKKAAPAAEKKVQVKKVIEKKVQAKKVQAKKRIKLGVIKYIFGTEGIYILSMIFF